MLPPIFYLSILLLIIYYTFFFFSYYTQFFIFFITLIILFIAKIDKFKTIFFINIFFYLFLIYYTDSYISTCYNIKQGRNFYGIITKRTQKEKTYIYTINLDFYYLKQNKKTEQSVIKVIHPKYIKEGTYVKIPFIYFLNHTINKENIAHDPINGSASGTGIAKEIIKLNSYNFQPIYFFINFFINIKEKLEKFIFDHYAPHERLFYQTIFLGKPMPQNDYKSLFNTIGITHYLARSGLHIQILLNCLWLLFLFIGINQRKIIFFQTISLFLFYFISYPSISFWRSIIMFVIYVIAQLSKKPITSLHSVSIVCILTLILYPFSFLNLGTQLTFLTTTVLALLNFVNSDVSKDQNNFYC